MNVDINTLTPIMSVVLPPLELVFEEIAPELKPPDVAFWDGRDGNFSTLLSPGSVYIVPLDLDIYCSQGYPGVVKYPSLPSQNICTGEVNEDGPEVEKGVSEVEKVDLEADRLVAEFLKLERSRPLVEVNSFDHSQVLDVSRLYGNAILFGHDPCPRIVSVEFSPPNVAVEYLRDEGGATASWITQFNPFLWDEMAGGNRSLLELRRFSSWGAMLACCRHQRNQRLVN
jgi:hypothetical protein